MIESRCIDLSGPQLLGINPNLCMGIRDQRIRLGTNSLPWDRATNYVGGWVYRSTVYSSVIFLSSTDYFSTKISQWYFLTFFITQARISLVLIPTACLLERHFQWIEKNFRRAWHGANDFFPTWMQCCWSNSWHKRLLITKSYLQ